ncbi:MAG TPA: hypothetical protein PLO69_05130 [Gammaproteobacteria bacterium]|nr:hypothetical protein [Gammaproteobacteria bacterium]
MFNLNRQQAAHLADTIRIVAFAEFGFFGYHNLLRWPIYWYVLVWAAMVFLVAEAIAVTVLGLPGGNDNE